MAELVRAVASLPLHERRTIAFVVPGRAVGKARARAFLQAGRIVNTTPPKSRAAEANIGQAAHAAMNGGPPMQGAVKVLISVFKLVPPSWSKKKKAAAYYLTGKPDADNVAKSVGDACNGIVYHDDSQVSDLHVIRRYGDRECIEVFISEMTDEASA